MDNLEQYSRRQQLLFEGVTESENENTDIAIIKACEKVNITVTPQDIQRSHRLGRRRDARPRPIIAHFVHYKQKRSIVQAAKKDLFEKLSSARSQNKRGPIQVSIKVKECLTAKRAQLFKLLLQLNERKLVRSVWTEDGVLVVRLPNSDNLTRITTEKEFHQFKNKLINS